MINFRPYQIISSVWNGFSNMKYWKKAFRFFDQYSPVRRKLSKIHLSDEWNKADEYYECLHCSTYFVQNVIFVKA